MEFSQVLGVVGKFRCQLLVMASHKEKILKALIWDCPLEVPTQQSVVGICVFNIPAPM
jgi:hypothetical protein